jgi:hypothetical protein
MSDIPLTHAMRGVYPDLHAPKVRKESKKQTKRFGKVAKDFSGGRERMPEGIKKA